jgi:hypothetical protein
MPELPPDRPRNHPESRRSLVLVLALSVIVHALLMGLPVRLPEAEVQSREQGIQLVAAPAPILMETPPPPAPEPAVAEEPPSTPDPEAETRAAADQQAPTTEPPPLAGSELRRQALGLAAEATEPTEPDDGVRGMQFRAAPRLPGNSGWINAWVGPVTPSREQWQEADGSIASRTVLASGQVLCTTVRPPTMQEFFNPWMSSAVPMVRSCGRQRPMASNDDDPWQRPASH